MEYIIMVQRAWQILTRHKVLMLFGLLAVLAGQDALFNLHGGQPLQPLLEAIVNLQPTIAGLTRSLVPPGSEIVLIGVMLGVGFGLTLIGMLMNAALIGLTQIAERGGEITFKAGLQLGWQHIDRLIIIRLLFNLPFVVLSLIGFALLRQLVDPIGGPLTFKESLAVLEAEGLLAIFLIVSLSAGLFVGAIGIGADRAVVLDGMGIIAALKQGWNTLREHTGKYVVISGIFVSTLLMSALIFFCPVALLFADRVSALAQTSATNTDLTATLLNEPAGSGLVIIVVLLYAVYTTFTSITWTIAYRRYAR